MEKSNFKAKHHGKRLHINAMIAKFGITIQEFLVIEEGGFKYNEKSGWFELESDESFDKDFLIIKESGFHIEHESYIPDDGDGNAYTDYDKTFPLENQTLIEFLKSQYE